MSLFPSSLNRRQQAELGSEWSVETLVTPVDRHVSGAPLATQYALAVSCDDQSVERWVTTRCRIRRPEHADQDAAYLVLIDVSETERSTPDVRGCRIGRAELCEERATIDARYEVSLSAVLIIPADEAHAAIGEPGKLHHGDLVRP